MKKLTLTLFVLLGLPGWLLGQDISLPPTASGQPGGFITVTAVTTNPSAIVKWFVADPGINLIPTNLLKDTKTAIMIGNTPGMYRLMAWTTTKDGLPTDAVICSVTIVGPIPLPPGPVPPVPPTPGPVPIPGPGFRALIVYHPMDLAKMPAPQSAILYSSVVRGYLDSRAAPGSDGKTKEWRIWPDGVDAKNETQLWKDAMARPRTQIPWIIISNGTSGYEGPLPATIDDTMTLLKKYGG